jgi:hypothetical protein
MAPVDLVAAPCDAVIVLFRRVPRHEGVDVGQREASLPENASDSTRPKCSERVLHTGKPLLFDECNNRIINHKRSGRIKAPLSALRIYEQQ